MSYIWKYEANLYDGVSNIEGPELPAVYAESKANWRYKIRSVGK